MTETILSQSAREQIDKWILRFPPERKRSGVIEALRIVQNENGGWLTTELMDAVAAYLEMPNIAVYEIATFYSLYNLEPVGKNIIDVCTNISCMLSGSDKIVSHLKERLGVNVGQTTPDGKFTLREVECLGACVNAPMFQVGKKYYLNLTPEKVDGILEELK